MVFIVGLPIIVVSDTRCYGYGDDTAHSGNVVVPLSEVRDY